RRFARKDPAVTAGEHDSGGVFLNTSGNPRVCHRLPAGKCRAPSVSFQARGSPPGVRTLSTGPISVVTGVRKDTRTGIVGFNATTLVGSLSGSGGPDSRPVKHGESHHRPSRGASLLAVPCLF